MRRLQMKKRFTYVFGFSNKHGSLYSFFADYDDYPLETVARRTRRVLNAGGLPYAAIVRSNRNRYHVYVPALLKPGEVLRLHWFAKCDPYYAMFFLKHKRNVLRFSKKRAGEPAPALARELFNARAKPCRLPAQFCELLEAMFGARPPKANRYNAKVEASEYHMLPNGRKFYNRFLNASGLNARVAEVLAGCP